MPEREYTFGHMIGGILGGFTAGVILGAGSVLVTPGNISEVRISREQGQPAIMRAYKPGVDVYLVQIDASREVFIPLDDYVRNTGNRTRERLLRTLERQE